MTSYIVLFFFNNGCILILDGIYIFHFEESNLKNNVKENRTKLHLSQKELATTVGITRQTLSLIEKGEYNPSLKLCLNLCYALNKSLDELFWISK